MASDIRKVIMNFHNDNRIFSVDNFEDSFLKTLNGFSSYIQKKYRLKTTSRLKKISIENITEDISVDIGVKYSNDLVLSEWLFNEPPRSKNSFLYFALVKSFFLHYFDRNYAEFDHAVLNILTFLLIKEIENITSVNNVFLSYITPKLFPLEIAGVNSQLWHSLLNLLYTKNIESKMIFDFYSKLNNESEQNHTQRFANFVTDLTVKIEDVIAPINMNWKLVNVLEALLENGFEKSLSTDIGKKLGIFNTTIRKYYDGLISSFNTFWRGIVNFQKLNLHNYSIQVFAESKDNLEMVTNKILENPYVKNSYFASNNDTNLFYSPNLISPHIVSDNFNKLLLNYKEKKIIDDFAIQMIRRKRIFGTVTSYPFQNTPDDFKSFLYKKNSHLKKHVLSDEKRDFSSNFEFDPYPLDYNLLYFLSLIKGRYLVKGNFAVWVSKLNKLYEKNNHQNSTQSSQVQFLNQLESRALRRNLLSYSLFMTNFVRRGSDILLIKLDLPLGNKAKEELIEEKVQQLRIFSVMLDINLYDSKILTIPTLNHQHPVKDLIEQFFNKVDIYPEFYTANLHSSKFVPYHDLYDYEKEFWKVV